MSMAIASQLRHIAMKILSTPEMVEQGKAFRISNHLEMIRDNLWAINSFLMDGALRIQKEPDVAKWMQDVGVTLEDVDSLLKRILDCWEPNDENEGKKKRKMSNFLHVSINNNIQSTNNCRSILLELKETACLLNYLVKRGTTLGLWVEMMDSMDPSHDDYATILSEEVIGREDEDQIIDLLQQQQCDEDGNAPFIIAIDGSKYSGKTTLARKIYHHPWVRQHFQHRIWLDASSFRDFNSSMIAKEIARLLSQKPCTNVDCWPFINEHLGGDRYLLIFDDVYVSDVLKYKWEELMLNLLHCGAPGSKVILAGYTFYEYIREFNIKEYKLKQLPKDAWVRILLRYAISVRPIKGNNNIHKEKASPAVTDILIPLAKKFIQDYDSGYCLGAKCMGLMFRWRDKSQWGELANQWFNIEHLRKYFLWVHRQYWSIEDTRSSLYKLLFEGSEDDSYDEDVLYMLIAEGTLTNTRLKRNLQIMSFEFDLDQCFFRMKVGEDSSIPPQCRHLHLLINSKNILKSKKAIEVAGVANKLRTLILHRKEKKGHIYQIETKKLEGLFLNLTCLCTLHMRAIMIQDLPSTVSTLHCLRYLNLAENKIETLPESLCNLSNLCALILSLCKELKELPRQIHKLRKLQILKLSCCLRIQKLPESITRLVNLKELDVGGCCWLSKLPDDLSNLKNLMQLNMHGCASLTRMPSGIRQLTNLEVLLGYDAMDGLGNVMLSELQALTNLESLHIQHLERLISATEEEKDITELTILQENQHLNELMLHWEWWNDMVAEETFEPTLQLTQGFHRNLEELKVLRIISYMSIKLPSWLIRDRDSVLNKLTIVHLVNLRRCERLPALGLLPKLEEIVISGFDLVRVIDDDFYGKDREVPFYGLKRLTFSEMPMLEKWDLPIYFKRRLRWIKANAKIEALAKADDKGLLNAMVRVKAEAWAEAWAEAKARAWAEAKARAWVEARIETEAKAWDRAWDRAWDWAQTHAWQQAWGRARAWDRAQALARARASARARAKDRGETWAQIRDWAEAKAPSKAWNQAYVPPHLRAEFRARAESKAEAWARAEAEAKVRAEVKAQVRAKEWAWTRVLAYSASTRAKAKVGDDYFVRPAKVETNYFTSLIEAEAKANYFARWIEADYFVKLVELTLIQCPKLREFHLSFPTSSKLKLKLWLSNEMLMPTFKFNDWSEFWRICRLQLFGCQELRSLPDGLKKITDLEELAIINCNKLEALPIWLEQSSLNSLCVSGCSALSFIPEGLKVKGRLRNLIVEACSKLQNLKHLTDEWNPF
ncbi:putative disease resistance protein RGA3 [Zingiber officinale]|uniref:putative disease resistance protein RGA3 n=1 Tax=Zingiber officinale TaxID=94328 RepID=UPI001C4BC4F7|nr:putative disease resistance protein RGA3 [Zingiber officinale]